MTSDELLPLPELSEDELELLHYNPNTDDVVAFLHQYAKAYALANLQSAKPEDALGSLPVVAYFNKSSGNYCFLSNEAREGSRPLTDHAQATAEIAKRDAEIARLSADVDSVHELDGQLEAEITKLRTKLAGVEAAAYKLRCAYGSVCDPEVWGMDVPLELYRDASKDCAEYDAALATYEAAQETK